MISAPSDGAFGTPHDGFPESPDCCSAHKHQHGDLKVQFEGFRDINGIGVVGGLQTCVIRSAFL